MFKTIAAKYPIDQKLPVRAWGIDILNRVLQGTFYDILKYPFHQHQNDVGGGQTEYVPIQERRPSVRYALPKLLVDDSVSLLFSEGHFPEITTNDEATKDGIKAIIKQSKLNATMFDAATRGSVGSVVILLKVLTKKSVNRVYFDVMETTYLTPTFDPNQPDQLLKVTEKYKVSRAQLEEKGYKNLEKNQNYFWFQRIWDDKAETWFQPWPTTKPKNFKPLVDEKLTVQHNLGFCPMEWIKNLPGVNPLGNEFDGACTFYDALDGSIEIDYQLSQVGFGLRYSSDPTLVLMTDKKPASAIKKNTALVLPMEADAKLLEINGSAAAGVLDYVRELRQMMIEASHGNRAHPDKLAAAQSGRAMELLNQALIWLADRLRITYGEMALLNLLAKVMAAHEKFPLTAMGKVIPPMNKADPLALEWPPYYLPTAQDNLNQANTLKTLKDASLMSTERAVTQLAPTYNIEDIPVELAKIEAERQKMLAEMAPMVTETISG